jgi:hypothetical protein
MGAGEIREAADKFDIPGKFVTITPYGSGHINDTYITVYDQSGTQHSYIIQRINRNVFKDPPGLMDNFVRVTEHIRGKLQAKRADDIDRRVLTCIRTHDGANYFRDDAGNFWRALRFIENASTYDVCPSLEQILQAAKAFGGFQSQLVDLPGPILNETIPHFHDGQKRYRDFEAELGVDGCNRAVGAEKEINFLQKNGKIFDILANLAKKGAIPTRVTHNDTKINNVMFDNQTGEGICVIDLDTVMPGLSLYDFGDIARTTISDAAEDELDMSKVSIDMKRFEAVVRGYLCGAGGFLNKAEKDNLVLGGMMITLIMGARFLTDHLAGDKYYKISRANHNLDRCRVQFKLVELMLEKQEEMNLICLRSIQ